MAIGGAALRLGTTLLYALEFCCAGIILGIYSYFLAVQADRDNAIPRWQQAVEGISGAIVLYTIFAVVFTCCLGGQAFFALLGLIMNVLCMGGFIAIAVLTRDGAHSCKGDNVQTPLGNGPEDAKQGFENGNSESQYTYSASLGSICRLNTACFAVAIAGAVLFLLSIPLGILLGKHHKKEKRYGPSPSNNYTRGSGMKFWQRKNRNSTLRDPEVAAVPATTTTHGGLAPVVAHDTRPSHDTAYTGSTVAAPGTAYADKRVSGGYHTAPNVPHTNQPIQTFNPPVTSTNY